MLRQRTSPLPSCRQRVGCTSGSIVCLSLKVVKNRVHIDINMPDRAEMQRLQRLGARVLQEIHDQEGQLKWTIMADPEGNEFCAFPPTA